MYARVRGHHLVVRARISDIFFLAAPAPLSERSNADVARVCEYKEEKREYIYVDFVLARLHWVFYRGEGS